MITLTIDGNEVSVPMGTNLVDAAEMAGIAVPTYCYHPGLSVVGQCRICFVEIEGLPRLVTACSTPVQEAMIVFTASDRVREALGALDEEKRRIVVMKFVSGLSHQEIAEKLGLKLSATKMRVYRTLDEFKSAYLRVSNRSAAA